MKGLGGYIGISLIMDLLWKWTWLLDIEGLMLLFAISILFSFLGLINTPFLIKEWLLIIDTFFYLKNLSFS